MFASATVTKLKMLNPGNLLVIELTLPANLTINGREHLVQDGMRPGSGFWIEPLKQLYSRSNCSIMAQRHPETIIVDTYDKSDTVCGGSEATSQLVKGLQEDKISPLSIRTEVS